MPLGKVDYAAAFLAAAAAAAAQPRRREYQPRKAQNPVRQMATIRRTAIVSPVSPRRRPCGSSKRARSNAGMLARGEPEAEGAAVAGRRGGERTSLLSLTSCVRVKSCVVNLMSALHFKCAQSVISSRSGQGCHVELTCTMCLHRRPPTLDKATNTAPTAPTACESGALYGA